MVLEKTLESPLDCKKVQPVHSDTPRDGGHSWERLESRRAAVINSALVTDGIGAWDERMYVIT